MQKIIIVRPAKDELSKLKIDEWDKWSCKPSNFDWEYSDKEVAYLFEGFVKVKTEWEEVEIKGGDLVTFPKGLKCTWNVIKTVKKVYRFE